MRIETANCKATPECESYEPIPIQVAKSLNVDRINSLHQFDTAGIIGVPSPVGKIPIVFYVKETPTSGRRGIIYYDDYDSVCFMYPEDEHSEWCRQPYDIKYDKVEPFDNGVESGYRRNFGILELWVSTLRKWYNGEIIYRPKLKLQGCGRREGGYPTKSKTIVVEETKTRNTTPPVIKHTKNNLSSCGCKKGA